MNAENKYLFYHVVGNKPMIKVKHDGSVWIAEDMQMDDAARWFWDAVEIEGRRREKARLESICPKCAEKTEVEA